MRWKHWRGDLPRLGLRRRQHPLRRRVRTNGCIHAIVAVVADGHVVDRVETHLDSTVHQSSRRQSTTTVAPFIAATRRTTRNLR